MKRVLEQAQRLHGQEDRMARMGGGAWVTSSDSRTGKVTYTGSRGADPAPIGHPYFGPHSWFRVQPERNTKIIVSYRGEDLRSYVSAYLAEDLYGSSVASLIDATEKGKFWFRTLREGEMQAMSPGCAETSWLANGNVIVRGGSVAITLRDKELEIHAQAPVHRRTTLGSKLREIGNEERFGVVTRPSPADQTQTQAVQVQGEFVKEYLRSLKEPNSSTPLVDIREGVVIDDSGTPVLANGNKLRLRARYGTTSDREVVLDIDETGNVSLTVPQSEKGLTVKTQQADAKLDIGKSLTFTISENWNAKAKKVTISADSVEVAGKKKFLTQDFEQTLQGADALPVATTPADAVAAVNAVVAFLKLLPSAFTGALTTKATAG